MNTIKKIALVLGWIWTLPITLGGLLMMLVVSAKFYKLRPAGVLQFTSSGGLSKLWFDKFNFAATTIGAVTIFHPDYKDNPEIIRHERQHTYQCMVLGIFFPLAYYGDSLFQMLIGKNFYRDNNFEKSAYSTANDIDG
jgi:hypothetical protein